MVGIDYAFLFDKICEGGKHKTHLCIPLRQGTARDWRGVPKFMDEPTTGLDPQTRKLLWNVISGLKDKNKMTVFLTTHYMEEASDADYVVILDGGRISAEGTPRELKNEYTGDFITLYGVDEKQVKKIFSDYEYLRGAYRIAVPNTSEATKLIIKYPEIFEDYEIVKGKMDDVFLSVTGKKLLGGSEK